MTDQAWTRATTVASTLADRYGLEKWAQRNTVLGLGLRQDLYAQAASCTADDRQELERIVEAAQEAAKASSGANLGTALHRWTERIDRGEDVDIPDPWRPDLDAYTSTLQHHSVTVLDGWVERVVIVPQYRIAGTLDRILTSPHWDAPRIGDVKTGADALKYGSGEIAVQLAIYAGASHAWKGTTDEIRRDRYGRYLLPDPTEQPDAYDPMPTMDRDTAIVMHLPVSTGTCTLYEIDIDAGREAVRTAMWVREWRKRKNLSTPLKEGAEQTAANF